MIAADQRLAQALQYQSRLMKEVVGSGDRMSDGGTSGGFGLLQTGISPRVNE